MKKLFVIAGVVFALVLTGCSNGQSDGGSNPQNKNVSVKVQWDANASANANVARAADVNKIKVHFYKVPIINGLYTYAQAVEIDSFEVSEGESLDRDYREQVPEGYILGFSADEYVMKSKANDGYVRNGEDQETFFELRFETLKNGLVLPSTLLGKSIDDEELYDLPGTNWTYYNIIAEGEWDEEIYFKNGNYRLSYFDYQSIVSVNSNTGMLSYWFSQGTATEEEKTLAKNFMKERFGITDLSHSEEM